MKEQTICLKCKSENVKKEMNVLLAVGVPQKWKCNNCGFISFMFPIKENKSNVKEK